MAQAPTATEPSLYPDPMAESAQPPKVMPEAPEPPAVTAEPPLASSEPPKTSSEPPKTSSEPPKTSSEPPKTSSEPPETSPKPPEASSEPPEASSEPPKTSSVPPPNESVAAFPPDYEVLIEVVATVKEKSYPSESGRVVPPLLTRPMCDILRVIQGPLDERYQPTGSKKDSPIFLAFISIGELNIPLLKGQPARRCGPPTSRKFAMRIPDRVFHIQLDPETEPELIDGFERILEWFCRWEEGDATEDTSVTDSPGPSSSQERFAHAGDRGVEFVESVGGKINSSIQRRIQGKVEKAREAQEAGHSRDIKMGGAATSKVLTGARNVLGAGAGLASGLADRLSGVIGTGIAKNPVTRSLSEAPEGTKRRGFYDNLMAGMLAFGRVYVAFDEQGKTIIANTGTSAGDYAGAKYGKQAEDAARNLGHIALDGYRVFRFPEKFYATSLLKGAFTSTAEHCDQQRAYEAAKSASRGEMPDLSRDVQDDKAGAPSNGKKESKSWFRGTKD